MKINAAAHLFRSARELGLLAELREGQRTLTQLCEKLSLKARCHEIGSRCVGRQQHH